MQDLRTLLSHLHSPHRLDTPLIRALLAHHRRLPSYLSPQTVGPAAVALFTDSIKALDPGEGTPAPGRLPYLVLDACFLRGRKLFQAAPELGLSERQLSRERTRALSLLAAELAAASAGAVEAQPVPSTEGHVRRDEQLRRLAHAATAHRLVAVTGEPGAGKTSLVAALGHALGAEHVWWQRIRAGVNDSLEALLHDLSKSLAREGSTSLQDFLAAALPRLETTTATRLALDGLAASRWRLMVLDNFEAIRQPQRLGAFLEEIVERLPNLSLITVGAGLAEAMVVEVPSLSPTETAQLFGHLHVDEVVRIHELSGGNIRMLSAVAAWWRGDEWGLRTLDRHLEGRGPMANLADLMAFTHRGAA